MGDIININKRYEDAVRKALDLALEYEGYGACDGEDDVHTPTAILGEIAELLKEQCDA